MNWLAHVFLSQQDIDFQLGNYLADPLKGKLWPKASQNLQNGLKTHILIDSFTDSHEVVKRSKDRLRDNGLLKSIVMDITYDYFLSKHWNKYCNIPFDEFTEEFYTKATQRIDDFPFKAANSVDRIIKYRILNKYQTLQDLEVAFIRIDRRLSPKLLSRDSAASYFKAVSTHVNELEEDFIEFFPELCKMVKQNIDDTKINHWKI